MNYNVLAKTALKLLTKFGKPVTLTRTVGGTLDPGTGVTTGGTTSVYSGSAVEVEADDELETGSEVQKATKSVLASFLGSSVVPSQGSDTLMMDGQTWKILRVQPVQPGAVVLAFYLWVS